MLAELRGDGRRSMTFIGLTRTGTTPAMAKQITQAVRQLPHCSRSTGMITTQRSSRCIRSASGPSISIMLMAQQSLQGLQQMTFSRADMTLLQVMCLANGVQLRLAPTKLLSIATTAVANTYGRNRKKPTGY
jgi:hypothetical protein